MTLALDSAFARLARAAEHHEALRRQIAEWSGSGKSYRADRIASADFMRHTLVFRMLEEPSLHAWSLMASDAIHNLRSVLDHLIYAVAVHEGGDPPPAEKRLAFLICDSPESYAKSQWKIDTLSPRVRGAIERVQPYNRPHPALPPLLTLLREIDDANKHRVTQLITSVVNTSLIENLSYAIHPQEGIGVHMHTGAIVDGVELLVVQLNRPTPDLDYRYTLRVSIALPHIAGPPPQVITRSGIDFLLAEMTAEVKTVVDAIRCEVSP